MLCLGGMHAEGRTWAWAPTWSEVMGVGGFDLAAANHGAYGGLIHGIACRPKPPPPPQSPRPQQALPISRTPKTPGTPSSRP